MEKESRGVWHRMGMVKPGFERGATRARLEWLSRRWEGSRRWFFPRTLPTGGVSPSWSNVELFEWFMVGSERGSGTSGCTTQEMTMHCPRGAI
jgi:hypothetical protein